MDARWSQCTRGAFTGAVQRLCDVTARLQAEILDIAARWSPLERAECMPTCCAALPLSARQESRPGRAAASHAGHVAGVRATAHGCISSN